MDVNNIYTNINTKAVESTINDILDNVANRIEEGKAKDFESSKIENVSNEQKQIVKDVILLKNKYDERKNSVGDIDILQGIYI